MRGTVDYNRMISSWLFKMAFGTPFLFIENDARKIVPRIFEANFSSDTENTTTYGTSHAQGKEFSP
jgi:hypothetical protein